MRAMGNVHLWGLAGIPTAGQFILFWGFLGLFRPGFPVAGVNEAHCPLGQVVSRDWARLRLDSPSSSANRSLFLVRPR